LGIKPVVGVLDFITKTTEGIRNTTTYWDGKHRNRIRQPRYFGPDQVLQPYSSEKAQGQEYLHVIEEGKYRNQSYLYHVSVEGRVVLLSDSNVFCIRGNKEEAFAEWSVPIQDIRWVEISNVEGGIVILSSKYQSSNLFESPTNKRVIFVQPHQVEFIFKKLVQVLRRLKHPSCPTTVSKLPL